MFILKSYNSILLLLLLQFLVRDSCLDQSLKDPQLLEDVLDLHIFLQVVLGVDEELLFP